MALTINTNISSLIAQRNLDSATNILNTSIERMTTGYKINHAADNAAGYSIANMWVTQLGSLDTAADNAATGADMLTTTEESYGLLVSHLQRVRDLTEQAANGTYGSQSLRAIQAEVHARLQEVDRIAANAEFNGIKLMSFTGAGDGSGIRTTGVNLQVGLYANANSSINLSTDLFKDASIKGIFAGMTTLAVGNTKTLEEMLQSGGATNLSDLSSTTDSTRETAIQAFAAACCGMKYTGTDLELTDVSAKEMLAYLDAGINEISGRVTKIGAAQNRVESAISALDVQSKNITSSLSTLRDTDIAEESSNYIQAQILQQASATLLSTANQLPSIALNLI
ncbi:hypothetical protein IKB17_06580 [bacterium]|nr:hypothetical protein [bacterium]